MGYIRLTGIFAVCFWACCVFLTDGEAIEVLDSLEVEQLDSEDVVPENNLFGREQTSLRCHHRLYKTKIEQYDEMGRRCWGIVSLKGCWGRCDSHQISEWKFPFRRSKHPVCGFGHREKAVVELQHCEEGATATARNFHYVEPASCTCRVCSSTDTSCGWLPDSTQ